MKYFFNQSRSFRDRVMAICFVFFEDFRSELLRASSPSHTHADSRSEPPVFKRLFGPHNVVEVFSGDFRDLSSTILTGSRTPHGSQTLLHDGSRTPGQSGAWIPVTRHTLQAIAGPPTLRPRGTRKSHHRSSTLSTTPKPLEHQLCITQSSTPPIQLPPLRAHISLVPVLRATINWRPQLLGTRTRTLPPATIQHRLPWPSG
eukprot:XP_011616931.1 PREDICTED: uncharacterized protein LOC105418663 isoform X2 [Takifugu rubripes]